MEKFHNSPPVDPVVSITAPEIKKRLGSWVRCSISVLVIGGMATAFAAEELSAGNEANIADDPSVNSEAIVPTASSAQSLTTCDLTGINIGWDKTHGNRGSYSASTLMGDIGLRGASTSEINSAPITKEVLANYNILWVEEWGNDWSTSEIEAVKDWVNSGGYLVMHGDELGGAVPLAEAFEYSIGSGSTRGNTSNIVEHYTTKDVSTIYMSGPLATISSGPEVIVISDNAGKYGVAAHEYGAGRIVIAAIDDIFHNSLITQANNRLFGNQVIDWFVCGGAVAGPGKFEFTSKIYFANENAKNAIVKVVRKGGSNGVVSVNYATAAFEDRDTVDPTSDPASEGEDYATTEGTLTWKNGETGIQTFKVPVFDDQDEEGDETVQLVLSSPNGAALGDKKKISAKLRIADDECHGVYTTAARTLYHPLITVPIFDPITGQPTQDIQVFEGTFSLLNGTEDFIIDVTDEEQFNFVKNIKNVDKLKADCYAKYDWQTETFQIPYVDTPSIVVLPMGKSRVGPTQIFRAKMQQMPLSGEYGIGNFIFHVEGAPFQDSSITADANASVKTESKDEVEAEVDASIEIAPDELTYYQYLYTYDK